MCPSHFRTTASVLFIYWTPDNYSSRCYNLERPGFVQTDHTWSFGVPLWSNYSTPTSRRGFGMEWQLVGGNWWLYTSPSGQPGTYTPVGYYPSSIYNGAWAICQHTRSLSSSEERLLGWSGITGRRWAVVWWGQRETPSPQTKR